jgi:acetyl esterase/lipase
MNAKKLVFLFVAIYSLSMHAQPKTMKVWPNGIPGSKSDATYQETTTGGTNGDILRIGKISEPELIVFLPKAGIVTGTAVLIIPGGGYSIVAIDHEGYAIAKWLNDHGIAGIVLKYRLPSDQIMDDKTIGPLQDAQEAMRIVRRNADQWKINPNKIGVMGFSAGGHLASTLSTHFSEKVYDVKDNTSARPDFSLLIYPVITFDASFTHMGSRENLIGKNPTQAQIDKFSNEKQISFDTPPAFLVHSTDDGAVPVKNSIEYYLGLKKNNIPCELHIFQKGGHGYGLALNKGTESAWPQLCLNWLEKI